MKPSPILIVDSNPQDMADIAAILEKARYTVLQATKVSEADGILASHRGKVVVLSELGVDGGGLRFLDDTLRKYPFLPFIFIGTSPPLNSVLGALRQGAYDFLRKPIPPDILLHSVARSIQKLSLTLETEKQEKEIQKLLDRSLEDLKDARTLSSFKGFMISMAAHDFRSIITVLDAYLHLLKERCKGCDMTDSTGMLDQAARTIGRLRTMTSTLLDYEAAESGSIRLDIRPFPLAETLKECLAFYRPYAEQKKVHLDLEANPHVVTVLGDRGKVMQILDNLLYNALKFTPPQGTIHLSGTKEDGLAVISVTDSGAGIPKEKLRKIFNQAEIVATLDSNARLGLGLTICKRLVEAQKGKIHIDSVPGKGTQVSFSLPSA
ncbi:MAG: hybrid sensor histidine kinase/response regulator [Deltaproteobacteria bacterium]|nr:hybrid sensor histidine kinase/response regulator [Deltaproteobacteria bacterium]